MFISIFFFFPKTVSSLRDPNQSGICIKLDDIAVALNYIYIHVDMMDGTMTLPWDWPNTFVTLMLLFLLQWTTSLWIWFSLTLMNLHHGSLGQKHWIVFRSVSHWNLSIQKGTLIQDCTGWLSLKYVFIYPCCFVCVIMCFLMWQCVLFLEYALMTVRNMSNMTHQISKSVKSKVNIHPFSK